MRGEGRGRSRDKSQRSVSWWAESQMRDSYSAIMTQERGRREGWRDTSQDEAAPLTECFSHSKVTCDTRNCRVNK